MKTRRLVHTNEMGDEVEFSGGTGDHVIFRARPKPNFKPNPIGFGADMDQHPKYQKPKPRKR